MNLLREPDAGKPPVRFDERDVETERLNATAPRLDSTRKNAEIAENKFRQRLTITLTMSAPRAGCAIRFFKAYLDFSSAISAFSSEAGGEHEFSGLAFRGGWDQLLGTTTVLR